MNNKRTRDISLRTTHLEVDSIVAELRALRLASLERRNRHDNPPRLPTRTILTSVIEGISAALFPNRLGSSELADEGIDHYVGHTLNMTLRELIVQIQHELHYNSGLEVLSCEDRSRSLAITQAFAKQLPEIRKLLESDIKAAYEGDPAARNVDEVLVWIGPVAKECVDHAGLTGQPVCPGFTGEFPKSPDGLMERGKREGVPRRGLCPCGQECLDAAYLPIKTRLM